MPVDFQESKDPRKSKWRAVEENVKSEVHQAVSFNKSEKVRKMGDQKENRRIN